MKEADKRSFIEDSFLSCFPMRSVTSNSISQTTCTRGYLLIRSKCCICISKVNMTVLSVRLPFTWVENLICMMVLLKLCIFNYNNLFFRFVLTRQNGNLISTHVLKKKRSSIQAGWPNGVQANCFYGLANWFHLIGVRTLFI